MIVFRHHGILVDSVASLLDGQKYSASTRHPFITLLEMRPETWPYIYQQMSSLLSYPAFSECNIHQMKPFVIHVLCHGDSETRLGLWSLLMTKLNYLKSTLLANLLLESLVWQKVFLTGTLIPYLLIIIPFIDRVARFLIVVSISVASSSCASTPSTRKMKI